MKIEIKIARDFTKYPYGRFIKDHATSAESFIENIIIPALKNYNVEELEIDLDDTEIGYSSSFLEEMSIRLFGFIINKGYTDKLKINFISKQDPSLLDEIEHYYQKYFAIDIGYVS